MPGSLSAAAVLSHCARCVLLSLSFTHIEKQTFAYVQVGKYWVGQEMKQIKSMPAAIAMAKTNAMMRKGDQSYNQFILECFK